MRTVLITILLLVLSAGAQAEIVDDFDNYATGMLTEVSGGFWHIYEGGTGISTDCEVSAEGLSAPNAMRLIGGEDLVDVQEVLAYSDTGNMLNAPGDTATLAFDFFVHEQGDRQSLSMLCLGSGDPAPANMDYDSSLTVIVINYSHWDPADGVVFVHLWDIAAGELGGGNYGFPELSTDLTVDQWHHVELVATQGVEDIFANDPNDADGTFEVWIDYVLVTADPLPFGFNDINNSFGLNAIDISSWAGEDLVYDDYILYDNISVTSPVPTVTAGLAADTSSGTLPFSCGMSASLRNNTDAISRRMAARIDVDVAGGASFPNWRAGFTNVAPGTTFTTAFTVNLPALGSLVGDNEFTLFAEDVTPAPWNQPPYLPAGDTDADGCTVTGMAP